MGGRSDRAFVDPGGREGRTCADAARAAGSTSCVARRMWIGWLASVAAARPWATPTPTPAPGPAVGTVGVSGLRLLASSSSLPPEPDLDAPPPPPGAGLAPSDEALVGLAAPRFDSVRADRRILEGGGMARTDDVVDDAGEAAPALSSAALRLRAPPAAVLEPAGSGERDRLTAAAGAAAGDEAGAGWNVGKYELAWCGSWPGSYDSWTGCCWGLCGCCCCRGAGSASCGCCCCGAYPYAAPPLGSLGPGALYICGWAGPGCGYPPGAGGWPYAYDGCWKCWVCGGGGCGGK